jgi:hypothetical protein
VERVPPTRSNTTPSSARKRSDNCAFATAIFKVECPDAWGETVYEASPNGDGMFDDDERVGHLDAAQAAIVEWWRERTVQRSSNP